MLLFVAFVSFCRHVCSFENTFWVEITHTQHSSFKSCCFIRISTRRFVVCLSMCHFVLVFFSPFSIAITSLGEERPNRSAFRTFVRFVLV